MFKKFRANMIRLEDRGDHIIIRSMGGGKKTISRKDIEVVNYSIFRSDYGINKKTPLNNSTHKYKAKISVQGFCSSGSSAMIDILREFDNVSTVSAIELETQNHKKTTNEISQGMEVNFYRTLKLYKLPDLLDMDELYADMFIKEMIFNARKALGDLCLCNLSCDVFLEFNKMLFKIVFFKTNCMLDKNYLPPVSSKQHMETNLQLNDDQYVFYQVRQDITKEQIIDIVNKFVSKILTSFKSNDFLVLDQFLATSNIKENNLYLSDGYDLDFHQKFVGDIKQVAIYRDPRDQFMDNWLYTFFLFTELKALSAYAPLFSYPSYKNILDSYKQPHPNRLFISFESLVNDYENSVDKICSFLGIDKSHHVNKFKHFNPEVSRKNIGIYKNFHDQKLMQQIYENFKEYCYEG